MERMGLKVDIPHYNTDMNGIIMIDENSNNNNNNSKETNKQRNKIMHETI